MRKKTLILVLVLIIVLLTALIAGEVAPAFAADGDPGTGLVTAAVGTTSSVFGTRSVTAVSPTVLALIPGSFSLTGTVTIVVTEAARTGTAEWSVSAILDEVGPAGSGNGLTDSGTPASYIPRSAVSIGAATPTLFLGGGAPQLGSSGDLSAARTLYRILGQDPLLNYTGTYTSAHTVTLDVPNAQKTGVYTGTLRVTLVQ